MKSETPRTDIERLLPQDLDNIVSADFARQLERELVDARDNASELIAAQATENIKLTEQRDRLAEALQETKAAIQASGVLCGREYDTLGIKVNNALKHF